MLVVKSAVSAETSSTAAASKICVIKSGVALDTQVKEPANAADMLVRFDADIAGAETLAANVMPVDKPAAQVATTVGVVLNCTPPDKDEVSALTDATAAAKAILVLRVGAAEVASVSAAESAIPVVSEVPVVEAQSIAEFSGIPELKLEETVVTSVSTAFNWIAVSRLEAPVATELANTAKVMPVVIGATITEVQETVAAMAADKLVSAEASVVVTEITAANWIAVLNPAVPAELFIAVATKTSPVLSEVVTSVVSVAAALNWIAVVSEEAPAATGVAATPRAIPVVSAAASEATEVTAEARPALKLVSVEDSVVAAFNATFNCIPVKSPADALEGSVIEAARATPVFKAGLLADVQVSTPARGISVDTSAMLLDAALVAPGH